MSENADPYDETATLVKIKDLAARDEVRLSQHARIEMSDEAITTEEVLDSIHDGRILENYPEHQRGPCCLVYGRTIEGRDLHVVVTTGLQRLLIITVYEPRLPWWKTPTSRAAEEHRGGEST